MLLTLWCGITLLRLLVVLLLRVLSLMIALILLIIVRRWLLVLGGCPTERREAKRSGEEGTEKG
jgi:hypothetical protein